jgi:hypothetical protein
MAVNKILTTVTCVRSASAVITVKLVVPVCVPTAVVRLTVYVLDV